MSAIASALLRVLLRAIFDLRYSPDYCPPRVSCMQSHKSVAARYDKRWDWQQNTKQHRQKSWSLFGGSTLSILLYSMCANEWMIFSSLYVDVGICKWSRLVDWVAASTSGSKMSFSYMAIVESKLYINSVYHGDQCTLIADISVKWTVWMVDIIRIEYCTKKVQLGNVWKFLKLVKGFRESNSPKHQFNVIQACI